MSSEKVGLPIQVLLLLLESRLIVLNLARGYVDLRLKVARVYLKKQFPFLSGWLSLTLTCIIGPETRGAMPTMLARTWPSLVQGFSIYREYSETAAQIVRPTMITVIRTLNTPAFMERSPFQSAS
jgi:hypothetical protein